MIWLNIYWVWKIVTQFVREGNKNKEKKPMSQNGKEMQNFTERYFLLYPGNSRTLPTK